MHFAPKASLHFKIPDKLQIPRHPRGPIQNILNLPLTKTFQTARKTHFMKYS
jgi:hypothetical protein